MVGGVGFRIRACSRLGFLSSANMTPIRLSRDNLAVSLPVEMTGSESPTSMLSKSKICGISAEGQACMFAYSRLAGVSLALQVHGAVFGLSQTGVGSTDTGSA